MKRNKKDRAKATKEAHVRYEKLLSKFLKEKKAAAKKTVDTPTPAPAKTTPAKPVKEEKKAPAKAVKPAPAKPEKKAETKKGKKWATCAIPTQMQMTTTWIFLSAESVS